LYGGVWKAFDAIFKEEEPAKELLGPYISDLVNKTKAVRAANPEKTVCVAFSLYIES
jgi:hypothetical protein